MCAGASTISQSVLRKDARAKVLGRARYVDDLTFPGMIYGVTVRSPVPRGRIRAIHYEGDLSWKEFTVITAKDLPGPNSIAHILKDQPCLAAQEIHHAEEPVLLLAHSDRYLLEEARRNVRIEVDPLPAVLSIEESLAKQQIIWGKDNILKSFHVEKGDVDRIWKTADLVVDGEYRTGAQEQLYLEPNGMIAIANPKEGVTVWGSMQCPFYVHHALAHLFGISTDQVRVVQAETGGGFGGKEDYPSVLACHAAALAWKSGKPVKMIYDRAEDMAATTKRHPSRTRHRTAVSRDGKLLAMDIDFVLDGGAYATLSSVVLSRGTIHAAGPYRCPNVRVHSQAVATNTPPHGAFRGFGVPQSLFALERHMDRIAEKLGMDPAEFRRRNLLKKGDTTVTGQVIRDEPGLEELLEQALRASDYRTKKSRFEKENAGKASVKQGIGLSVFMHGAGFTGSGERNLSSVVAIEATPEGQVRVLVSSTEMGQGSRTVLSQIVAEQLRIEFDQVEVAPQDTSVVPNSGPTVASRTTMVVGKLLENAAVQLRETLIGTRFLKETYTPAEFPDACARYIKTFGKLSASSRYEQPAFIHWDEESHLGDAYGTFAWAVYVADVAVDTLTFETQVTNFVAAQEIGKVMHPTMATGQIQGGVVQGIGYALYENVIWKDGHMSNPSMTNYIVPTLADAPPIQVLFAENPYSHGPSGAKGIGELPLDGVAPAVVNAVAFATSADLSTIPVLPETLMEAVENG